MLSAVVLSADGTQKLEVLDRQTICNVPSAEELGRRVAASLLEQGAAKLIAQSRSGFPT
jgi:porphobilinogen deaminase